MGKHGGVAARQHVPIPAVVLAVLLLAGVVTGSWWWSSRVQSDPIDQNPVPAAAFVLSSPSCSDHGTGTVVDLMPASGGQARAVVDGCGYSNGEQVAVEYLAGDPSQARLAGTRSPSTSDDGQRWWPVGLGILAVLAAGIVVVLVLDGRRFRRRGAPTRSPDGAADLPDPVAALTAMVSTTADRGAPSSMAVDGAHRAGRHARLEFDDQQPAEEWPGDGWVRNTNRDGWLLGPAQSWAAEISVGGEGQMPLDDDTPLPPRLDLVFPSTAELAASLHDELFTHRHAQVSGG